MQLNLREIRTLLDLIGDRRHVSLYIEDSALEAQSVVLGGDLDQNVLCMSETFPDTHSLLVRSHPGKAAYLRIKVGEAQYLVLALALKEYVGGLSYWEILTSTWTKNKRWQPRLRFEAFHSPRVTLVREFKQNLSAELHDISESGFSVSIWNKDLQHEFSRAQHYSPQIQFNEHFSLRCDAEVLGVSFVRKPCCHTRLRFRFTQLSEVERSQLALLRESLRSHTIAA